MAWDDVLQRDVSNAERQQMNANMTQPKPQGGAPLEWYDFINPANYFGANNFYERLGGAVNGGVGQMGQALQQSLTTAPQAMTQAATMASNAVNQAVAPLQPQPQPAPMAPQQQEPNPFNRDYGAVNQSIMRSALEQLNGSGRMTNPYGKDNSGYLASQAQVVGQEGQSLLNALRSQQASNAMRGIKQSDGLAQNQQNQMRMQTALGRNAALTGLETQRYDKAAEWDKWDNNNRMQLAQAVDSGNINRFNAIMGQRNTEYEQGRQSPFDAIKLQDAQTRLGYLDRTLGADLQGKYLGNENQTLQNTRYGYGNTYAQNTLYPSINAANQGYSTQATESRLAGDELNYWGQDDNRNFTRGLNHFNRGFKPVADVADAFAKPGGKFVGAMLPIPK
jgi:hypothetical protein